MMNGKNWYALLTRSRFENIVYENLTKKSIEAFLPKIKAISRRKDRRLMIDIPLFPGYLFVRTSLDPENQLKIIKTIGAVRLLGCNGTPVSVTEDNIESLKIITGSDLEIIKGSLAGMAKGTNVIIVSGPMAGVKGEFVKYKNKNRVIIRIETMGQFAGVETNENNIEKLPDIIA